MLKLTFCLRRLPNPTLAGFQDHRLDRHGPLVRRLQPALGMVRDIPLHRLDSDLADGMRKARGAPEPYDGVAELRRDGGRASAPRGALRRRARRRGCCCSRTRQNSSIWPTRRSGSTASN